MSTLALRPRPASEIVDAAFQLYRRHFSQLVTLSAAVFAPYVLIQLLVTGGQPIDEEVAVAGTVALVLGAWLFGSLAEACIVVAVSNSYLRNDPDVGASLRQTLRRFGRVLLAVSAKWFVIGFVSVVPVMIAAVVAAIVVAGTGGVGDGQSPAAMIAMVGVFGLTMLVLGLPLLLYFFGAYFAVPATVVLEGLGVIAGLKRSSALSKGHKWKVYGALGIPLVIFQLLQLVITLVTRGLPIPAVLAFVMEQGVTIVGYPIIAVIATLLYYDARIRKEGFDLEMMAAELGTPIRLDVAPQE